MTRYIKKEIIIDRKVEVVFDALIAPSQIKKWWYANSAVVLPEVGGFLAVAWGDKEDDPDYITISSITELERPYKLKLIYGKYFSKSGPLPFEAEMDVTYTLEHIGEKTKLIVVQDGFPISIAANEYYQGCVKGWEDTLGSIKSFLENR